MESLIKQLYKPSLQLMRELRTELVSENHQHIDDLTKKHNMNKAIKAMIQ